MLAEDGTDFTILTLGASAVRPDWEYMAALERRYLL